MDAANSLIQLITTFESFRLLICSIIILPSLIEPPGEFIKMFTSLVSKFEVSLINFEAENALIGPLILTKLEYVS